MASSNPELRASYDFIICGGGTSGCVIASRLASNSSLSILVLEAGPPIADLDTVHMAGLWSENFDKETDWNIVTPPQDAINGRQVKLSRGKFLGGSSSCNATLCIRGSPQDYDDWGVEGWSGQDMFAYMKKAERFSGKPWFQADKAAHGYDGLIGTAPHDVAPISELILESMQDKGLSLDHDMFSHGENPHGCGHVPRTVTEGWRRTSADYVTKANKKSNIDIVTGAHVDKVLIERDGDELVAKGVQAILANGETVTVQAQKEVVISGGTYCSPAILNRSGIGAKEELDKHGIRTVLDLPAVGKNLMDHIVCFIYYETEKEGLTRDVDAYHNNAITQALAQWKADQTGFLSEIPFGVFGFARLDSRLEDSALWTQAHRQDGRDPMGLTPKQPSMELMSVECYGGPKQYTDFPVDNKHCFIMIPQLFGQRSRGTVTLKTADARDEPVVDCAYLTDDLDLEVLAEACNFANDVVMTGLGTKGVVKGSWPAGAQHHTYTTREEWKPFVREHGTTCYHPVGTCTMGNDDNPRAVVDAKLRVRGVKGLRVADCSIMPLLPGCHTQMPAYGIGEKAADMIKEAWSLS